MEIKFKKYGKCVGEGDFFERTIKLGDKNFYILIAQDEIHDDDSNVIGSYYMIDLDHIQIRDRSIKTKKQALDRVKKEIISSCRAIINNVRELTL